VEKGREMIRTFCLALALSLVSAVEGGAADMEPTGKQKVRVIAQKVRVIARDRSGERLDLSPNGELILTDVDYNPVIGGVERAATGEYELRLAPGGRFHLLAFIEVPGFGKIKTYADNGGQGYALEGCTGHPLDLVRELARSRSRNVLREATAIDRERRRSNRDALTRSTRERLRKVEQMVREEAAEDAAGAYDLLRESMWLGEEVVIDLARERIARNPQRDGFLFGANCFAVRQDPPGYREHFAGLLNFGTVPFYLKGFEPEEGRVNSRGADTCLAFLEGNRIRAKGHPLVWFYRATTPEWLDGRTFEGMIEHVHDRVKREVIAYQDRIEVWDVINEAHDWANCYEYSHEQLLELTRAACDAAREADSDCVRIVNSCLVFGEYVAGGRAHQSKGARQLVTPYQYLQHLIRDGVDFEVVGLQLYYTGFDLFEHKRLFDRFARLGKPLHVTEVAVPSATGVDEGSHFKGPEAVPRMGVWHRPWDQELQAEWVEGFYTVCYGHPAVEAVTWWDFSDQPPHFFPHGGFLDKNGAPKASYRRLRSLLAGWGFRPAPGKR